MLEVQEEEAKPTASSTVYAVSHPRSALGLPTIEPMIDEAPSTMAVEQQQVL